MDKTIAAIRLVGEFLIASHFFYQLHLEGRDLYSKTSFFLSGMFFLGLFEIAFYWHILR
jgi:hypothetical protein